MSVLWSATECYESHKRVQRIKLLKRVVIFVVCSTCIGCLYYFKFDDFYSYYKTSYDKLLYELGSPKETTESNSLTYRYLSKTRTELSLGEGIDVSGILVEDYDYNLFYDILDIPHKMSAASSDFFLLSTSSAISMSLPDKFKYASNCIDRIESKESDYWVLIKLVEAGQEEVTPSLVIQDAELDLVLRSGAIKHPRYMRKIDDKYLIMDALCSDKLYVSLKHAIDTANVVKTRYSEQSGSSLLNNLKLEGEYMFDNGYVDDTSREIKDALIECSRSQESIIIQENWGSIAIDSFDDKNSINAQDKLSAIMEQKNGSFVFKKQCWPNEYPYVEYYIVGNTTMGFCLLIEDKYIIIHSDNSLASKYLEGAIYLLLQEAKEMED